MNEINQENYKKLSDRAEGAYLRRDFLDAFLIQSCLVEGVLKAYCETRLSYAISQASTFKEKINNYSLATLMDVLFASSSIGTDLYSKLNKYRKARNKVIHHLLELDNEKKLNEELQSAYELGRGMKGFIVDDMLKTGSGNTLAEIESQFENLFGQIEAVLGQLYGLDSTTFYRLSKMFKKIDYINRMKTIIVDAVDCFLVEQEDGSFKLDTEMHELLETYPNPKIAVTGVDDEQWKEWNLDAIPYETFTLKHNPDKVDPEYYKKFLAKYDLAPEDVVYFEHGEGAVESARSVGITTYHYDNKARDLSALKAFLDEKLKG